MQSIKYNLLLLTLILIGASLKAQTVFTPEDEQIFDAYSQWASPMKNKPLNELIIQTAKYFEGKPYVASTLEGQTEEKLVINLREFDCTTYIETCYALAKTMQAENPSFILFADNLILIRYRQGGANGYSSRLHYVSDWIYSNEEKSLVKDISLGLYAVNIKKVINFMTLHSDKYQGLKNNLEETERIRLIETAISQRNTYNLVPVNAILEIKDKLQDGDFVFFASKIKGLDYSHVGIIHMINNQLKFIHASSKEKRIFISEDTLYEYALQSKSCSGISIVRPL